MDDQAVEQSARTTFSDVSSLVAKWTGSPWALLIVAALVVVSLVLAGPEVTSVTVSCVTLLMVFVLQNTENRHAAALHVKLDEMVRVEPAARDDVRGVESKSVDEIEDLNDETVEPGRPVSFSPSRP